MTTEELEYETVEKAPADRPFNPWRRARTERAKALVAHIRQHVEAQEAALGLRKRARRGQDQETFEHQVDALVSDLAYEYVVESQRSIAITQSKRILSRASRYRPPVMSKTLPQLMSLMASVDFPMLDLVPGHLNPFDENSRFQTTIRAGEGLRKLLDEQAFDADDFCIRQSGESIILRGARQHARANTVDLEYEDTETTAAYRADMARINAWLKAADISCEQVADGYVDADDRFLQRIFNNGSFDQGGRLYGGFWQSMKKAERREAIRIAGEEVVTLDFGQLAPRLLYARVGLVPAMDDTYRLPSLAFQYRDAVKRVMNAMLNSRVPLTRFPADTRELVPKKSIKVTDISFAILKDHCPISHFFHTGVGLSLMFEESQMLVKILLELIGHGVVALPIHDALVVPISHAPIAKQTMETVFSLHTGQEALVGEE